jgi:hypothetical protein
MKIWRWSRVSEIHNKEENQCSEFYLHRQVIRTLLIANLKARKVGVLDGKAICLLKVLYN